MLGSAIATSISDIPFDGPCATTQVGLIDGEFIINPTAAQKKVSDLALTVASTREKVIMIEAGANEVPEDTMIEAIFKADEVNKEIIAFIDKIVAECGKEKHSYESCAIPGRAVCRHPGDRSAGRDGRRPYLQTISRPVRRTSARLQSVWRKRLQKMKSGFRWWETPFTSTRRRQSER